ncbi:hypothetical protein GUJ93_ZPchr0008g11415 [Zizania palustris]|uniref:Uncharacterized protein n=1 Tax=Zizania palustris TaxID=103762 RepID=A0A8J5R6A6_ZIZPA|nr:hypothetical protein GUJ93_ZPchr0008g11415 [Zizania palustris]
MRPKSPGSLLDYCDNMLLTSGTGFQTGLGRHPVLGIPTASDEWWETNTEGHLKKGKRAFCYAPPPCLKQWEIMFEKSHVSGQSTCISSGEVCGTLKKRGTMI